MDQAALPVVVEAMQLGHLPEIMEIEREAFSLPWPERTYRHELTQNDLAHYYVVYPRSTAFSSAPRSAWQRLRQATQQRPPAGTVPLLGYGGFWLMYDEAHISNLAVRATYRRRALGELLLVVLLDEAQRLGACRATLEVRTSNVAAQALYAKYNFQRVGRRKAYYSDNREDALILTTPEFASPTYQDLINTRRRDLSQRIAQISLDKIVQMH